MATAVFVQERDFGMNIQIYPPTTTPGPIPVTGMATRIIRIPSGTGSRDFGSWDCLDLGSCPPVVGRVGIWDCGFKDKTHGRAWKEHTKLKNGKDVAIEIY